MKTLNTIKHHRNYFININPVSISGTLVYSVLKLIISKSSLHQMKKVNK